VKAIGNEFFEQLTVKLAIWEMSKIQIKKNPLCENVMIGAIQIYKKNCRFARFYIIMMSLKAKEENRLKYDEMLIVEWRKKFTKKLSDQDEETMDGEEIPTKTQWTE